MPKSPSDMPDVFSHDSMQRWRAKFARDMLMYAIVFALLAVGTSYMNGIMWDKMVSKFASNPFRTTAMAGGMLMTALMIPLMVFMCLKTAWETRKFSQKMDSIKKGRGHRPTDSTQTGHANQ